MSVLFSNKFRLFSAVISLLAFGPAFETWGTTRFSRPFAVFINESPIKVQINVISDDNKDKIVLPLPPEAIEGALFAKGRVELRASSEDMVSGRLLFTRPLPSPKSASNFYEASTHTFYFRVLGEKIILVKPRDLSSKERRWLRERTKRGW